MKMETGLTYEQARNWLQTRYNRGGKRIRNLTNRIGRRKYTVIVEEIDLGGMA